MVGRATHAVLNRIVGRMMIANQGIATEISVSHQHAMTSGVTVPKPMSIAVAIVQVVDPSNCVVLQQIARVKRVAMDGVEHAMTRPVMGPIMIVTTELMRAY